MRQFKELYTESIIYKELHEAVEDSDTVTYEFKNAKNKPEFVKNQIVKCIATLKDRSWGVGPVKEIAAQLSSIKEKISALEVTEKELKNKVRTDIVDKYFTADEEVYTRVIVVSNILVQVSKESTRESFDKKGFFEQLYKLGLTKDIIDQIEALRKQYTKESSVASSVTVKTEDKHFIPGKYSKSEKKGTHYIPGHYNEAKGYNESVETFIYWFKYTFKRLLHSFDTKLDTLKTKFGI